MSERYRRKAGEVAATIKPCENHEGKVILMWPDAQTDCIARERFEREYEPVLSGHDFDPWRESIKLADKLAEAVADLMEWGVELDDERLKYLSVQVHRTSATDTSAALSAYLKSRKGGK